MALTIVAPQLPPGHDWLVTIQWDDIRDFSCNSVVVLFVEVWAFSVVFGHGEKGGGVVGTKATRLRPMVPDGNINDWVAGLVMQIHPHKVSESWKIAGGLLMRTTPASVR